MTKGIRYLLVHTETGFEQEFRTEQEAVDKLRYYEEVEHQYDAFKVIWHIN